MPAEVAVPFIMASALSVANAIVPKKTQPSFYDFMTSKLYYFTSYPEEYTDVIDFILMEKVGSKFKHSVGNTIARFNGDLIPGFGEHTMKIDMKKGKKIEHRSICLQRLFLKNPLTEKSMIFYRAKYFYKSTREVALALLDVIKIRLKTNPNIQTVSIDTAMPDIPKLLLTDKIYREPKLNQTQALNLIFRKWDNRYHFNLKIMICGLRGVGKTQMGLIIKKHMDTFQRLKN